MMEKQCDVCGSISEVVVCVYCGREMCEECATLVERPENSPMWVCADACDIFDEGGKSFTVKITPELFKTRAKELNLNEIDHECAEELFSCGWLEYIRLRKISVEIVDHILLGFGNEC